MGTTPTVQATIDEIEHELARKYRIKGMPTGTTVQHEIVVSDLQIPFPTLFMLVLKVMVAQAVIALCLSATVIVAWVLFLSQLLAFGR